MFSKWRSRPIKKVSKAEFNHSFMSNRLVSLANTFTILREFKLIKLSLDIEITDVIRTSAIMIDIWRDAFTPRCRLFPAKRGLLVTDRGQELRWRLRGLTLVTLLAIQDLSLSL